MNPAGRFGILLLPLLWTPGCSNGDANPDPGCPASPDLSCPTQPDVAPCPLADGGTVQDGGSDASDLDTGELDLGPPRLPERSCATVFRFHPTYRPARVALAGEWNDFAPVAMEDADGNGQYQLTLELEPRLHAYKFVVQPRAGEADEWLFDPANAYRKAVDGTENSAVRVPDCTQPLLEPRYARPAPAGPGAGWFAARLQFVRGQGGPGPDPARLTATLRLQGGARRDLKPEEFELSPQGTVELFVDDLPPGKHVVEVRAWDLGGQEAKLRRFPFWIEQERFDWQGGLVYLIMTDRFRDGRADNNRAPTAGVSQAGDWQGGDLKGVQQAIADGTFDRLGVRVLWLTPFNTAAPGAEVGEGGHRVTGYHGYWPIASRSIDPALGDHEALVALVEEAHAHGIRVMMDLVLNHVHEDHEYVREHPDWFRSSCICGTPGCDWTGHRLDCLFAPYLLDVDWTRADAAETFIADALWWLAAYNLDGFRVDAVKHVEELAVTNLAVSVREEFETAGVRHFLLGETAMGWGGHAIEASEADYATIGRYVGPDRLDGQFDFVLYHAVVNRVLARDEVEGGMIHLDYWTLASLSHYPPGAIMTPYLGSHDTGRFVTQATYRGQDPAHPTEIADRKWEDLPLEPDHHEPYDRLGLALTWLLTLPGMPLLYYGDEYGEFGGQDPDNRHLWRPPARRSDLEQQLHERVSRVALLRRELVALREGDYRSLKGIPEFLCFARHTGQTIALVALNRSGEVRTETVRVPLQLLPADGRLVNLLADGEVIWRRDESFTITLPPRGAAILVPAGE